MKDAILAIFFMMAFFYILRKPWRTVTIGSIWWKKVDGNPFQDPYKYSATVMMIRKGWVRYSLNDIPGVRGCSTIADFRNDWSPHEPQL